MSTRKVVPLLLVLLFLLVGAAIFMVLGTDDDGTGPVPVVDPDAEVEDADRTPSKPEKVEPRNRWEPRGPGSVVGFVREYGTDRPLADVAVSLEAGLPGPDAVLRATTGEDGSFHIDDAVNFDEWMLRVKPDAPLSELQLNAIEVVENQQTDLGVLYVTPGFSVPGIVVDDRGDPVAGAIVRVLRQRAKGGSTDFLRLIRELPQRAAAVDTATTGTDGRFELTKVPPGRYDFELSAEDHALRVDRGIVVTPETAQRELRFVIQRGYELSGRVVRPSGGNVANMRVVAFEDPQGLAEMFELDKRFATTDENGDFKLTGLAAGEFMVAAIPEGEPFAIRDEVAIPGTEFLELVIQGDAWIEGTVSAGKDQPVADAEVYVVLTDGGTPSVGNTLTDATGRYRIDGLRSGPVQVFLVQAEGYGSFPDDLMGLLRGGGSGLTLSVGRNVKDVELSPGAVVRGIVLNQEDDQPVEGARVSLLSPMSFFGGTKQATTGADGRFEMKSVPKGAAILMAEKEGYFQPGVNPQSVGLLIRAQMQRRGSAPATDPGRGVTISVTDSGQEIERELKLATGSVLRGVVLSPEGEPVPGAQVTLERGGGGGPFDALYAVMGAVEPRITQADGSFELPGPAPGQAATIVARMQGFLDGKSASVSAGPGETVEGLEVTMRQGAVLEGLIKDAKGTPISGAMVRWIAQTAGQNEWQTRWTLQRADPSTTGDDGRFRVQNVEPGKIVVQVTHTTYLSVSKTGVETTEGAPLTLDFELDAGGRLEGLVTGPDGKPHVGARVEVSRVGGRDASRDPYDQGIDDPLTGSDGKFAIEGMAPGQYEIYARAEGLAPSASVTIEAGGAPLSLRLEPAYVISGTVVYADGETVPGARISVHLVKDDGSTNQVESDVTSEAGDFVVRDIPAGRYEVHVGQGWWGGERANVLPTVVKDVQAGQEGLRIEANRGLRIGGEVRLADGNLAADGWAQVNRIPDPNEEERVRHNGGGQIVAGTFEIAGLPPGRYSVTANIEGQAPTTVQAEAGKTDLVVRLGEGGSISGRVLAADGAAAANATVYVSGDGFWRNAQTDADGVYKLTGIPAGTYEVVAQKNINGPQFVGRAQAIEVTTGDDLTGIDISLTQENMDGR